MIYTAVIEIPKGDTRRRHWNFAGTAFEDFGPIKDVIPVNDGIMPVHYGFLKGIKNIAEGDEVDILLIGEGKFGVGDEVQVKIIGLLEREDGDDKFITVEASNTDISWLSVSEIDKNLILDYFGYKSKIKNILSGAEAEIYLIENPGKFKI